MKRLFYLSTVIVLLIGLLPAAAVANGETDPPDTTIDTGPDDPTNSTSATFTFHGDDGSGSGVARFECQLDDGGFDTCVTGEDYTALLDGYHKFEVRAVDANGNVDPYPADYYWFVDTVPPDTTIDTGSCPANPIQFNGVTFTFSGSDPGYSDAPQTGSGWSDCDCSLDGAAFEPCEYNSQQTYLNLEDGSHTFEVRAIDWAGNADQSPDSCTWVVDTVAPVTTIDSGPDNPSNSDSATFEFSGDDGTGSGVDHFVCWHWPEGFDDPCSSSKSYSGLSDGEDTFEVYAVDKAGNPEDPPAKYTWVVDTTPPETTIDDSPSDPSDSTSATFKFSGDDGSGSGVAHFECQLDDEPPEACDSGEKTYTGLGLGSHTFSVYATDALGNADQTPATYTWEIAIQGPGISLVKKTDVNGEFFDNNDAPGRALWVLPGGGSVSWRYEVKNTGTTVLTDVTVTDDKVPAANINCYSSNVSNVIGDMDPGASVTCEGWDSAVAGEYANTGTVTGTPPEGEGDDVTASDPEYYFGADPQLAVAVVTADGATAGDDLTILLGEPIVLRYTVTNPGNVPISDVFVSNNPSSITPVYKSGDTSNIGKLDPNETWIYEASNTAIANWPGVTGFVDGSYTDGYDQTTSPGVVRAEDSSKYSSADPQIDIVKTTVGSNGSEGDNVAVNAGGPVTWKYYVTNTGNVPLSDVKVTDDKGVAVTCPSTTLPLPAYPGEAMTCTATGTNNLPGGAQYSNTGAAEGSYTDSAGHKRTATDSDASSYTSAGVQAYALSVNLVGAGKVTADPPDDFTCPPNGTLCTGRYDAGAQVKLTAVPDYGYKLSAWSGACTGAGDCTVAMTAAKSVTATFTRLPAKRLTVTKAGAGRGAISADPVDTFTCGSWSCSGSYPLGTSVKLTATPDATSVFAGWSWYSPAYCTVSGANLVCKLNADITAKATFNPLPTKRLTVTVAGAGKGTITASPPDAFTCGPTSCSGSYPPGTVVTLTAAPADADSSFAGWTGLSAGCSVASGNPAKLICTLNADLTATATFTKPATKLAVTVTGPAGKGYVTASPLPVGLSSAKCSITGMTGTIGTTTCTWSYSAGSSVKLTATAAYGYKLLAWSGACSGSYPSCTVTMTSGKSVTATFARW